MQGVARPDFRAPARVAGRPATAAGGRPRPVEWQLGHEIRRLVVAGFAHAARFTPRPLQVQDQPRPGADPVAPAPALAVVGRAGADRRRRGVWYARQPRVVTVQTTPVVTTYPVAAVRPAQRHRLRRRAAQGGDFVEGDRPARMARRRRRLARQGRRHHCADRRARRRRAVGERAGQRGRGEGRARRRRRPRRPTRSRS